MRFPALPLAFALALVSSNAAAQAIDARTWRASTDPGAGLVLEPVASQGGGNVSFGAWGTYAHRPVTLRRADDNAVVFRPVSSLVTLDLTANIGVGSRASLGLDVPLYLYQDGD